MSKYSNIEETLRCAQMHELTIEEKIIYMIIKMNGQRQKRENDDKKKMHTCHYEAFNSIQRAKDTGE